MIKYRTDRVRVVGNNAFSEASKEELRALLALMELGCQVESADELAEAARISPARAKSAQASPGWSTPWQRALWQSVPTV